MAVRHALLSVNVISNALSTVAPTAAVSVGVMPKIVCVLPLAVPVILILAVVFAFVKDAINVLVGVAPLAMSAINKYLFTEDKPVCPEIEENIKGFTNVLTVAIGAAISPASATPSLLASTINLKLDKSAVVTVPEVVILAAVKSKLLVQAVGVKPKPNKATLLVPTILLAALGVPVLAKVNCGVTELVTPIV